MNKENFWVNTQAKFEIIAESDNFDELLLKGVKEYSNREAISHFNKLKTVFWIRYDEYAYRIAENKSYETMIGDNCYWKLTSNATKKYSIAKVEYNICQTI